MGKRLHTWRVEEILPTGEKTGSPHLFKVNGKMEAIDCYDKFYKMWEEDEIVAECLDKEIRDHKIYICWQRIRSSDIGIIIRTINFIAAVMGVTPWFPFIPNAITVASSFCLLVDSIANKIIKEPPSEKSKAPYHQIQKLSAPQPRRAV